MATNNELTDSSQMPFGTHKGKRMIDVPGAYLMYLYNQGIQNGNVRDYIVSNLDALRKEAAKSKR